MVGIDIDNPSFGKWAASHAAVPGYNGTDPAAGHRP
jgi:hypothetical protein